ncbi:STAS domain-containing protein [Planctomycetota bacterium]
MSETQHIQVDELGDVIIVQFAEKKIIDELVIQELASELIGLVEQGHKKIILNFSNVEFLSSAALGKLILMDKKAKACDGEVKLCEINSDIYPVFQITKLDIRFDIKPRLSEAVAAFAD